MLGQVFDPYFTTKTQGHGLGLSIVHSIIQRHGGHVTVDSTVGEGTRFTLYLPVADAAPETGEQPASDLATGSGRVLLMDDEETIHRTVGRTLRLLGYRVESVRDGAAALAAYRAATEEQAPFDLVIMDLTIPGGMGGRETIGQLLALDPQARALVASGYSNDPVVAAYAEHGFVGRITKPVDIQELATTVKAVLEAR